jgi:iron complex transport system substrate-binding protein
MEGKVRFVTRQRHTWKLTAGISMILTLVAAACVAAPAPPQESLGAGQAAERPAIPAPITLVDGRGKEIALAKAAGRVVTIPMPSASILMAIDGSAERLVGMHPSSMQALKEGILRKIYPDALNVATDFIESGFVPNVEAVLAHQPDVIFQWANLGEELIAPLENAGLTVIGIEYGTQEQLESLMRMKGRAIGKSDKVERIIAYHHATQADIAHKAQAIPDDTKPRVLYFLRYGEQLRVSGRDTFNDFYIHLVGGKNVAAESEPAGHYDINLEQVLAWDPEVILLGGFDDATPGDVYSDPRLASVSAVVSRRVYKAPLGGYRWDPPSQESPLMWMWLAHLLHPGVFDYDLRAEMKDFYRWVYGYDLTEEDIDAILRMALNRDSANYGQFAAP